MDERLHHMILNGMLLDASVSSKKKCINKDTTSSNYNRPFAHFRP